MADPRHGGRHPDHRWPRPAVAVAAGAAVLRGHGARRAAAQRRQLQRADRLRRGMAGGLKKWGWLGEVMSYN